VLLNDILMHNLLNNCLLRRSEHNHTAMKRALMDRLADFKGFLPPYSIAQVELSHVKEEFVHSRSTVESACEAQQKTVPSSAGDVYL